MPIYSYKALTVEGKSVKGKLDANNETMVISILRDNGYYPIDVQQQGLLQKDINISFGKTVKTKDLSIFCRQFATMLDSGISILEDLSILEKQTENKYLQRILRQISESVEGGKSLASSMAEHKEFPAMLINMVEAGEVSGNLEISFNRMAEHFEKEFKLHQLVQKATTYPAIVSIVSIIVIGVLVTFVVPNFVSMFKDIGMELPGSTKALLAISNFIKTKWYLLIIIILAFIFIMKYFLKTDIGKMSMAKIKLRFPVLGKVTVKVVSSRFTRTLSTLLASGLQLNDALDIVAKVVDNHIVEKGIIDAKEQVSRGIPLSKPIGELGLFPPMVTHMIKTGENTGDMEGVLNKVADFYDSEVETAVAQLTTMLEPMIIVIMAVVVGFIVISIVQPMFQMYNGLGNL